MKINLLKIIVINMLNESGDYSKDDMSVLFSIS